MSFSTIELGNYIKKKYGRTEYLSAGARHKHKIEWQRKWRAKNPEKVRELGKLNMKRRRENKPDELKEYKKKQYVLHSKYYKEKSKIWREQNKERFLAQQRSQYIKRNIESILYIHSPRCPGCTCILKDDKITICKWCLDTYPSKYMQAINDFIVIKPIEEKKKSLIILADEKNVPKTGQVMSVGDSCEFLRKNDIIQLPPYADELEYEGKKYLICHEKDIAVKYKS